jgi:protein ImuA
MLAASAIVQAESIDPAAVDRVAPACDADSSRALPDPARIHSSLWRANQLGSQGVRSLSSSWRALDRELPGGGWPLNCLTELLMPRPGIGEMRLLAPVLRRLTQAGRTVVFLAPPHIPYAPALAQHGIALEHLLVVQAAQPADRLWAIEQTMKSASFGALVAWMPEEKGRFARPDQLRRLQLAAQSSDGLSFLFRPLVAQTQSSPAALRIALAPMRGEQLSVRIFKRRGPALLQPIMIDLPCVVPSLRRLPESWMRRGPQPAPRLESAGQDLAGLVRH